MKSKRIRGMCALIILIFVMNTVFFSCKGTDGGNESASAVSEAAESDGAQHSEPGAESEAVSESERSESERSESESEPETSGESSEAENSEAEVSDEPEPSESSEEQKPDEKDEPTEPVKYKKEFPEQMPVLTIETKNRQEVVSREDYVSCVISSSDCAEDYRFESSAGIRVRGNASSNYGNADWIRQNKVHYRIKFESKQNLFGLNDGAKCKSWVLLRGDGNYAKEEIPFFLFRRLSGGKYYSSDYTFVRVILNGDDLGAYVLCEQNQINKHRINIDEQEDGETYLNTGYLMELENYPAGEPYLFRIHYGGWALTDPYGYTRTPRVANVSVKNDTLTNEQLKYISDRINNIYALCYRAIAKGEYCRIGEDGTLVKDDSIRSARECIENYVALDSFVWSYILEEFAIELDVGVGSFFFYIDLSAKDPKLTFCAPWDYSWAFHNDYGFKYDMLGVGAWQTQQFIDYAGDRSNPWFVLFYSADWFREEVCKEWKRVRGEHAFEDLFAEMRQISELYRDDFAYTRTRWNEPEQQAASEQLIHWMTKRIGFLDELWIEGNGLPELPEKRENIAGQATYEVHDFFRFGNGYAYSETGDIVYGDDGNDLTDGKRATMNFHDAGWVGINAAHPNAKAHGQYLLFAFDSPRAIGEIYLSVSNLCDAGISAPEAFEVLWSQDGKTWSETGITGRYTDELEPGLSAEYGITVNRAAKYWKIVVHFGEGSWCFLDEVEFVPQKAASSK